MNFRPGQTVAAGDFFVGKCGNSILNAYLGSCVGVTIVDEKSGVGGMAHFLLPEPLSLNTDWYPERYALTGLPLFLEALAKAGANPSDMKACLAGGALVGHISEQDLQLDIGGRTADVVEKLLNKQGISIEKMETGGYFTCLMSLDMNTWQTGIEPLGAAAEEVEPVELNVNRKNLVISLGRLRPIPQIALKIIRMLAEDDIEISDIAAEIKKDQTIAAKVLSLCNSSFFSTVQKIDSIDRALILLGDKNLLKLVISATMETFFPEEERGYSLVKGGLYQHAVGTALAAGQIAKLSGLVKSDIAYTAGLLHDIGKVALDQQVSRLSPMFYRKTQIEGQNLLAVESELIGEDHAELGGRMAEYWKMPENLQEVIRHHHHPEKAGQAVELTHIIYFADLLMSRFHVGLELENINTDLLDARLERIGLSRVQFPMLVDSMPTNLWGQQKD